MNVLIVEDDRPFMELVRHALEPRTVRVAHSMQEALAMIDESAPEILMLDLALPDSTPAQTMARIRELKARSKNATVIVVTGYPEQKVMTEALKQGADSFLSKDAKGFFSALPGWLLSIGRREQEHSANESTVAEIERQVGKIVSPE